MVVSVSHVVASNPVGNIALGDARLLADCRLAHIEFVDVSAHSLLNLLRFGGLLRELVGRHLVHHLAHIFRVVEFDQLWFADSLLLLFRCFPSAPFNAAQMPQNPVHVVEIIPPNH